MVGANDFVRSGLSVTYGASRTPEPRLTEQDKDGADAQEEGVRPRSAWFWVAVVDLIALTIILVYLLQQ